MAQGGVDPIPDSRSLHMTRVAIGTERASAPLVRARPDGSFRRLRCDALRSLPGPKRVARRPRMPG